MFGDVGHGFIMFLFALFLVLKEKSLEAKKIRDDVTERVHMVHVNDKLIILVLRFSTFSSVAVTLFC